MDYGGLKKGRLCKRRQAQETSNVFPRPSAHGGYNLTRKLLSLSKPR
jgi:hypothetical protein